MCKTRSHRIEALWTQLKISSPSPADDVHPQPADRSSSGHPGEGHLCPRLICDSGMSPVILKVTVECTTEASPKAITYWVFKVVFKICLPKKPTGCSGWYTYEQQRVCVPPAGCSLNTFEGCDDPPLTAPPHRLFIIVIILITIYIYIYI